MAVADYLQAHHSRSGALPGSGGRSDLSVAAKYLKRGFGAWWFSASWAARKPGQIHQFAPAFFAPGQRRRREKPGDPPGDHDALAAFRGADGRRQRHPELVRLSIGLEHIDDILADLTRRWSPRRLKCGMRSAECGI